MIGNQTDNQQIRDCIVTTIKTKKPETTQQLITMVRESYPLPAQEITRILVELENEDKLHFTKQEPQTPTSAMAYMFSKKAAWYWITIALAILTTVAVFAVPEDAYPIIYLRSALGIIFVLYLPGYTFIRALFPTRPSIKTSGENMDTVERVALSLGMSLALTPIVGLILNYTPWGIRLTPVTLSLLLLTIIFATAAMTREYQTKLILPSRLQN